MLKAIGRLPALLNPLRGAFTRLGEAWGNAIDTFSGDLVKPDSIAKLRAFTDGAAKLAGPITDGLSALLDIFTDIGHAALPFLLSGVRKVSDKFKEWAQATSDTKSLRATISDLISHLRTWLGVAGSIASAFFAFLPIAAADGKSLAQSIKDLADRTTAWLRSSEGQEKVRKFFRDTIPLARDLGGLLLDATKALVKFGQFVAPIITALKKLNDATLRLRNIFLKLAFAPLFGSLGSGVERLRKAEKALTDQLNDAVKAQGDLTAARKDAKREIRELGDASEGAQLGQRRAKLDLADARSTLKELEKQGATSREIERATLDVADAKLRLRDATREAAQAEKDSQAAQREGISGNKGVIDALARRDDAIGATIQRQKDLARASRESADVSDSAGTVRRVAETAALSIPGAIGIAIAGLNKFAPDAFRAGADLIGDVAAGVVSVTSTVGSAVGRAIATALGTVLGFRQRMFQRGAELLRALGSGISSVAGTIATAISGAVRDAIAAVRDLVPRFTTAGRNIANAVVNGIKSAFGAAGSVGKAIANAIIGAVNSAIRFINQALPDKINLKGGPDINLPDNPLPEITKLHRGGPIPGVGTGDKVPILAEPMEYMIRRRIVMQFGPTVFADINEGRLDPRTGYAQGERPSVGTRTVKGNAYALGGAVSAIATAPREVPALNVTAPITVPGGGPPDPVALSMQLARELERRVGAMPRQD